MCVTELSVEENQCQRKWPDSLLTKLTCSRADAIRLCLRSHTLMARLLGKYRDWPSAITWNFSE